MRSRTKLLGFAALAVAVSAAVLFSTSASAIHNVLIEFTVVRGEPYSTVEVAHEHVEPWLQGESCGVLVEIENNASVHLDTDLIIASGDDAVTITNVETKSGEVVFEEGELVLGEEVVVSVRLGPDGIASGGIRIDFECDLQPPTTTSGPSTTTEPPPTSVTPDTTVAPTTTEAKPPAVLPQTTLPPTPPEPPTAAPEPPTAAQPRFTG